MFSLRVEKPAEAPVRLAYGMDISGGNGMTHESFDRWLSAYGAAWEAKDVETFVANFTDDARYYWTPFGAPKEGREGIAEAFSGAVANQRDIRFTYEILVAGDERCVAHWECSLVRPGSGQLIRLDGILTVEPAPGGLCAVFREWWHSDEVKL